jgi:hypothetical protein
MVILCSISELECLLNKDFSNFQPVTVRNLRTVGKKQQHKKNSQLAFASWLLRRRTDEEIIRLCAYWLLQDPCQNQIKGLKNC